MTKMQDPIEVYREALAAIPVRSEEHPPTILRAEAWPYPDLKRVWVRVETSAFAALPDLDLAITAPDGSIACAMYMVEIHEPYQSVTLHLRSEPQAGETYHLELALIREEQVLDTRTLEFVLAFAEPPQAAASS